MAFINEARGERTLAEMLWSCALNLPILKPVGNSIRGLWSRFCLHTLAGADHDSVGWSSQPCFCWGRHGCLPCSPRNRPILSELRRGVKVRAVQLWWKIQNRMWRHWFREHIEKMLKTVAFPIQLISHLWRLSHFENCLIKTFYTIPHL